MDGLGVLIYPYGEKSVVGEWKDGKECNTKHTKKDGTLIGKYENGKWIVSWGVLYFGIRNGKYGWYEDGDEKKDIKYVGEIKDGFPNGQGRVENRVTPALPHQTVHTVFPYTAFRYPSSIRHCASFCLAL